MWEKNMLAALVLFAALPKCAAFAGAANLPVNRFNKLPNTTADRRYALDVDDGDAQLLSSAHFLDGLNAMKHHEWNRAADEFFRARILNPALEEAADYEKYARERIPEIRLAAKQPSGMIQFLAGVSVGIILLLQLFVLIPFLLLVIVPRLARKSFFSKSTLAVER